MSNQLIGGSYPMSPKRQMSNYDRLPPELRAVLRDTVDDWCAYLFNLRAKKGEPFDVQLRSLLSWDAAARRDYRFDNEALDRRRRGELERRETVNTLLQRQSFRDAERAGQAKLL